MHYYIGIDGGGTKTHLVCLDEKKNNLGESFGGNSNFLLNGLETVTETLFNLINDFISSKNLNYGDLAAVVLGTTGAGRVADAQRLEHFVLQKFSSHNIQLPRFTVVSDARIALETAFPGVSGAIMIAGTGSIMFGKNILGEILRVGGFGRFLGDEGSGYKLGQRGLTAVARAMDGRGDYTILKDIVAQKFGFNEPNDMISAVYSNGFDIASVAPLVIEAAGEGDEIAIKILDEESDGLIDHIKAMKSKFENEILKVSFVGSVLTKENIFSQLFKKKLSERHPDVVIQQTLEPPVMGAVYLGMGMNN
ncbi:BadF/BadG/BcrA/BcrD ATPase family protein [Ignavibacteriales bacterium]